MSSGCKALLVAGVLFAVAVLFCCGGLITIGYYFARSESHDPAVVRQVTNAVVQIDIPAGFEPAMSVDVKVPFAGTRWVGWVAYYDRRSDGLLILAWHAEMLPEENLEDMAGQIQDTLRGRGYRLRERVGAWEAEVQEIEVQGRPVNFTFAKGTDEQAGEPALRVTGGFDIDNCRVQLMFLVNPEKFSRQRIIGMLESIR